jgi:hypothetical protein
VACAPQRDAQFHPLVAAATRRVTPACGLVSSTDPDRAYDTAAPMRPTIVTTLVTASHGLARRPRNVAGASAAAANPSSLGLLDAPVAQQDKDDDDDCRRYERVRHSATQSNVERGSAGDCEERQTMPSTRAATDPVVGIDVNGSFEHRRASYGPRLRTLPSSCGDRVHVRAGLLLPVLRAKRVRHPP